MGNVWGVANPSPVPTIVTVGADVTLAAGVETTFMSSAALSAPNPGAYYPVVSLAVAILFGATAPTALTFAFKLGAGADVDTQVVAVANMVVNATTYYYFQLVGANSSTAWIGAGTVVNITGLAATTAATFKFSGSRAMIQLERGPDL